MTYFLSLETGNLATGPGLDMIRAAPVGPSKKTPLFNSLDTSWNMAQIGKDSPVMMICEELMYCKYCLLYFTLPLISTEHHSTAKQIIYTQKCFAGKDLWRSCLPTSWALLGRAQPGFQHDSSRSLWSKIHRPWQIIVATVAALLPPLPGCIQRQCDGGTPP